MSLIPMSEWRTLKSPLTIHFAPSGNVVDLCCAFLGGVPVGHIVQIEAQLAVDDNFGSQGFDGAVIRRMVVEIMSASVSVEDPCGDASSVREDPCGDCEAGGV